MKKQYYIFLVFLLSTVNVSAQNSYVVSLGNDSVHVGGYAGCIDALGNHLYVGNNDTLGIIEYYDQNFSHLWSRKLPLGFGGGNAVVKELSTSDFIIVMTQAWGGDAHIMKVTNSGDLLWHNYIDYSASSIKHVVDVGNGEIIITYTYFGSLILSRLDTDGNFVWSKTTEMDGLYSGGMNIERMQDGNLLYVAQPAHYDSTKRVHIMKMSPAGVKIWEKGYKYAYGEEYYFNSYLDANENLYVVGAKNPVYTIGNSDSVDMIVRKFDSNGIYLGGKIINHQYNDKGYGITASGDGNLILFGNSKPQSICGGNLAVLKLDSNLDTIYTKTFGSPSATGAFFKNVHYSNNTVYAVGTGNIWSDATGDAHFIKADASFDIPCFNYYQSYTLVDAPPCVPYGDTLSLIDYTNTVPILTETVFNIVDHQIAYDACSMELLNNEELIKQNGLVQVYPNPVDDMLTIKSESGNITSVKIFDLNGKTISHYESFNDSSIILDLSLLEIGFYSIYIECSDEVAFRKIVKI